MERSALVLRLLVLLGLACALAPALGQQRPSPFAAPPAQQQASPGAPFSPARAAAASVILGGDDHAQVMRRLRVLRQYRVADLRVQPRLALGAMRVNVAPMLNAPAATANIAQKLRSLPRHVEVRAEETTVAEIEQGLVMHSLLRYRMRGVACRDADARAQLAAAGASCFTAQPAGGDAPAYSRRGDPRYVADPARRARALAEYQQKTAAAQALNAKRIAALRKALSDPQRRAAHEAKLGAAEFQRVSRLTDAQLEEEVVNSAVVTIEEIVFLSRSAALARSPRIAALGIAQHPPSARERFAARQAPPPQSPSKAQPPRAAQAEAHRTQPLGTYIYLTGFTLGSHHEWRRRVSVTIDWCLGLFDDCEETYYLEPHAGFEYGFGLRFPIQATLNYTFDWRATQPPTGHAAVKIDYAPVMGTPEMFQDAGLAPEKIFDGKEFVCEAGADAGLAYRVPILGSDDFDKSIGFDLTTGLPAPFTNGRFMPPAPGTNIAAKDPILLEDMDFLGGLANYGVAGAKVLPGVQVGLRSNGLTFTLIDKVAQKSSSVAQTGTTVPLGVRNDRVMSSEFGLADPVYDLTLQLTPGIDGRLFINIGVWSHDWDWWIPFPALEIDLPPGGGARFSCHDGTQCERDFSEPGIPVKFPRLPPSL